MWRGWRASSGPGPAAPAGSEVAKREVPVLPRFTASGWSVAVKLLLELAGGFFHPSAFGCVFQILSGFHHARLENSSLAPRLVHKLDVKFFVENSGLSVVAGVWMSSYCLN